MAIKTKKSLAKECCPTEYPYHGSELSRLNRVIGQLEGVKRMIEEKRYCPEILTLLRGTRSAIKAVEGNILETYLGSCVTNAFQSHDAKDKKQKINELKEIFKRFEE
jgi:DNA-binding FrmR family transcriptional regulator